MQNNTQNNNLTLPSHIQRAQIQDDFLRQYLQSRNETFLASKLYRTLELTFLLIMGALFGFTFPPAPLGLLAWIGVVPLIFFSVKTTPLRALFNGFTWGLGWAFTSFIWFYEIHIVFPIITALVLGLFPAVWSMFTAFIYKYIVVPEQDCKAGNESIQMAFLKVNTYKETLFVFMSGTGWVALEWVRSWIGTGLPWNTLATTQWQNLQLIQVCEYTGIYGVSLCVILVNLAIYCAIQSLWRYFRVGIRIHFTPLVLSAVAIMLCISIPNDAIRQYMPRADDPKADDANQEVKVGLIQMATPVIWGGSQVDYNAMYNRLCNLTTKVAINHKPDVILWPETMIPVRPSKNPSYTQALSKLARENNSALIVGAPDILPPVENDDTERHINGAFLFNNEGKLVDYYAKRHIVPFGEYIPFGAILDRALPNLRKDFVLPEDLTPGKGFFPLEVNPQLRLGVNICFEDVFPYISREFVKNGATVLATITNDGWYPQSSERAQHLANAVFRAIENRRYFVRTGNFAQACLITPQGQIAAWKNALPSDTFDPMEASEGSLCAKFILPRKIDYITFYTRYGDLFSYACTMIALLCLVWSLCKSLSIKRFLLQQKEAYNSNVQSNIETPSIQN